jgi:uncharacterized membrane protein
MPIVEVERSFGHAAVDHIWALLKEFHRYPDFAEHVVSVSIVKNEHNYKESDWIVLLNGNQLSWSERDYIDEGNRRISFEQISGDIAVWRGTLSLTNGPDCRATYVIEFDLGIPALADLLNPLGVRAVKTNCEQFLDAVARQLVVTV